MNDWQIIQRWPGTPLDWVVDENGDTIAHFEGSQAEEHAKLFVAAPDLLAACEVAVDALGCDRVRTDRLRAQELIHETIAKAKGD